MIGYLISIISIENDFNLEKKKWQTDGLMTR